MITTPPAQSANSQSVIYADEVYVVQQPTYVQVEPQAVNMQYSKISGAPITSSPVVTSSYPKYVAWRNAQNNSCCYVHERHKGTVPSVFDGIVPSILTIIFLMNGKVLRNSWLLA